MAATRLLFSSQVGIYVRTRALCSRPATFKRHPSALGSLCNTRLFATVPAKFDTHPIHYDRHHFCEYAGDYVSQGYHPVHLGDEFGNRRYKVVNKLGRGPFSTVWLAKDTAHQIYVAMKVLTGDAPINPMETELPSMLNAPDYGDGRKFISTPSDVFNIHGPNGLHKCLVLPATGPSIFDYSENVKPLYLPLKVAKRAVLETAKGIEYLHRNKIGHGDLHIGNILLQIPGLESWNETQILSRFGRPVRVNIYRLDGLPVEDSPKIPKYTVASSHVTKAFNFNGSVMIADFGSAYLASEEENSHRTSIEPAVCAPERVFGCPFGLPSDIWSLGCTIFAIVSGVNPFGSMGSSYSKDSTMLDILRTLGKPPEPWWSQWQEKQRKLGISDQEVMKQTIIRRSLAETIKEISTGSGDTGEEVLLMPVRKDEFSEDDIHGMVDLLSRMLVYEPERRLAASEVLAHPWMKSLQAEIKPHPAA